MKRLTVGRFVKIHSLASEKAKTHNGKTAIVKTPLDEETGRCGVDLDLGGKILAIKPSNLTILCSYCKCKEEQIVPEPILCTRCEKESYCSTSCKKKHWEGGIPKNMMPNCHDVWCIPMELEMEVPTQPINESNVGEQAYEEVSKYLQLAADIGNSGRRNEEKVMLEKLIIIDSRQPSAYLNLFHSCSDLAIMAERYYPDNYEELSFKAIRHFTKGIELIVSDEMPMGGSSKKELDGPKEKIYELYIGTINTHALKFMEGCMKGERGTTGNNAKLENIETCLMGIIVLFHQRDEPVYKVHSMLGFCYRMLTKYDDAVTELTKCCESQKEDKYWYHSSLIQLAECLSCAALESEEKTPAERVEVMEKAVAKYHEAITTLKKENPTIVYTCQSRLCRCLYSQNSMLNTLAAQGGIPYPNKQKGHLLSLMRVTADVALQGAVAAEDTAEVQVIETLQGLPFN